MPSLIQSLQGLDLGHLRIVAELWGLELTANEANQASEELATALHDQALFDEVIESLSPDGHTALQALVTQKGRIPWANFTRRFGEVREMGPGRRDREQPHLRPASAAEALFYRALLARAFFDTPDGPLEYAYVPDDLLKLIHSEGKTLEATSYVVTNSEPLGRPAKPAERAYPRLASDRILDDTTTLLAALRLGWESAPFALSLPQRTLLDLLSAARLIRDSAPQPDSVKAFLETPRRQALGGLIQAWRDSASFNELHQLLDLVCEGEWKNDPLKTRQTLLDLLSAVPRGKWWSLSAFIQGLKRVQPDFQRPAGDYDSWFIRRQESEDYLRGFAHWDEVDGALVGYFITGPLHWLGLADLAAPTEDATPSAFRLMTPGAVRSALEEAKLHVTSQGTISVPRLTPRAARYQLARFCEWEPEKADHYRYRLTPAALEHAQQQELKVENLLALLKKHAAAQVPPTLVRALRRWGENGTEAKVENQTVLRLSSPQILERLRTSKAGRFLGEPLGPTAVIVKPGAQSKVLAALTELGILAADETLAASSPPD
jgi:hypothetical protein